jgi:hypothetical protein
MPLFMDVHSVAGGVSAADVADAHQGDLATQGSSAWAGTVRTPRSATTGSSAILESPPSRTRVGNGSDHSAGGFETRRKPEAACTGAWKPTSPVQASSDIHTGRPADPGSSNHSNNRRPPLPDSRGRNPRSRRIRAQIGNCDGCVPGQGNDGVSHGKEKVYGSIP